MKYLIPIILLLFVSCNDTAKKENRNPESINHDGEEAYIGRYNLFSIEGHKYLSFDRGGIIHLESCPCMNGNVICDTTRGISTTQIKP